MDKYELTVDGLRKILDEISANGNGADKVVIKSCVINGYSVSPIEQISGGSLEISDGRYSRERINENGSGFVFFHSAEMLPVGFWKKQLSIRN